MCTVLLPPGGYPIAVNKYTITYHIISTYTLKIFLIILRLVTEINRNVTFLFPFYGIRLIVCIQTDSDTNNIKYSIIIIIIIWHYNPLWVFVFPAKSLQVLLPLAVSFQFLPPALLNLPWHPLAIVVLVFLQFARYSCNILMKLEFSRQIFEKYSNI